MSWFLLESFLNIDKGIRILSIHRECLVLWNVKCYGTFNVVSRLILWDVSCYGTFSPIGRSVMGCFVMGRLVLWDIWCWDVSWWNFRDGSFHDGTFHDGTFRDGSWDVSWWDVLNVNHLSISVLIKETVPQDFLSLWCFTSVRRSCTRYASLAKNNTWLTYLHNVYIHVNNATLRGVGLP